MCPGIRPATGWMRVADLDPAGLEQIGELACDVLGLGDRETVAGDDDDLAGVGEQHRDVLGVGGVDAARLGPVAPRR